MGIKRYLVELVPGAPELHEVVLASEHDAEVARLNPAAAQVPGAAQLTKALESVHGLYEISAKLIAEEMHKYLAAAQVSRQERGVVGWYLPEDPHRITANPDVCAQWHRDGETVAPAYAVAPVPPVQQAEQVPALYVSRDALGDAEQVGMHATRSPNAVQDQPLYTAPPAAPAQAEQFQARVKPWMIECFGQSIADDKQERQHRFLEEAIELVQAGGTTASEAHQLVDYVYGRPVGEIAQEVGGVMVTLAALCLAHGLDMHAAGDVELARVWTKVEAIREKQKAKPAFGPLPGAYPEREQIAAAPAQQPAAVDGREALDHLVQLITMQLELIAKRAPGKYLDKVPMVRAMNRYREIARAALAGGAK